MITNYDIAFEKIKIQASDYDKLLLHVCCAPCATYCLTRVLDKFDVTLYYANDNITDVYEWQKRLDELTKLVKIVNDGLFEVAPKYPLKLAVQPFDSNRFFAVAKGFEGEREGGLRCKECFGLRLNDTLTYAKTYCYDYFGTTLTVSPYKNSQVLNQMGLELEGDVLWLASDFKKRNGYNESVRLSEKYGLYRQHYCGCIFGLKNMQ